MDDAADTAVEQAHPQFDQDGTNEHRHRQPAELDCRGMQHFEKTFFQQFHTDDQDHHRHRQPGQVLIPGMAVGMFGIRRAGPQLEANQTYDVGTGVGQVVQTVRRNGNTARQGTYGGFSRKKQQVADNTDHTRQVAVGGAHRLVGGIFMLFDESAYQQIYQPVSLLSQNGGLQKSAVA